MSAIDQRLAELRIVAHGTPKPKGSLRHVGRGRLIEQVKGSKPWREALVIAAARARDQAGWECLTGAVSVACVAVIPRPKTVRRDYPITRSSGDCDKLARNLLDALVDAQIMTDDAQVVDLWIRKEYTDTRHGMTGMYVTVRTFPGPVDNVVDWLETMARGTYDELH
ncbi:MAG: RusA family crossover junction endodeoxyribonuclease [Actinomycetales bacterium]|nr:RusA family crossover junction endodeoxyribonuclease [Actinomycetales bacterium]